MIKKTKISAEILQNNEISAGIFDMLIYAPEIAKNAVPGQFVMVYTKDPAKLLPRPISLCDFDENEGTIRLVFRVSGKNTGTEQFSVMRAGETIDILGPIGNGYDISKIHELSVRDEDKENENEKFWTMEHDLVVLGGGIGIPPLLGLLKKYRQEYPEAKLAAVLGYRSNDTFLASEFRQYADIFFSSDDGKIGVHGNVIDAIKANEIKTHVFAACGPMPMLRGLAAYSEECGVKAFISLEERMACGVGACLGCVTKTKKKDEHSQVNNTRICVDGPVFSVEELEL